MMKDSSCSALLKRPIGFTTVCMTKFEGPLVPTEPNEVQRLDVEEAIDFMIEEQRETPEVSTKGEGTLETSTSALASTSEPVGVSSETTH